MKKSAFLVAAVLLAPTTFRGAAQAQTIVPEGANAARTGQTDAVVKTPVANLSDDQIRSFGQGIAFPYGIFESVLTRFVDKKGDVFYAKVKGDNDLETYVRALSLADIGPNAFPVFQTPVDPDKPEKGMMDDKSAELAFWINAYNALRIKAIADAYPINSLAQIKGLDTEKTRNVAGTNYSFGELRAKIAGFDKRAIFALMSGDGSGPRAPQLAARFSGLGVQLNQVTRAFINDISRVMPLDRIANKIVVSPYLQEVDAYWKPKNQRRKWDGIRDVLAGYTTNVTKNALRVGDEGVEFMQADSKINEQLSQQ